MKKPSIEEKAKAYDEAIERAKHYDGDAYIAPKRVIEEIFPELKESEDERIRKALVEHFKWNVQRILNEFDNKDVLAWLEKQGKQKTVDEIAEKVCKDKASATALLKSTGIMNEKGELAEQYRQDEQKPTDKVKPKFKIEKGKWYVCTQTYVLIGKLVVIKGWTYQAEKDDVIKGEEGCLFIDKHDGKISDYFRSWTIEDAKNGDMLAITNTEGTQIGIFKEYDGYAFSSYCFVDTEGVFKLGLCCHDERAAHPATKEQRDLLFQKMKEASYVWDAEKKELRKVNKKELKKLAKKTSNEKHNLTEFENKLLDTCYGWLYCEASGCEEYIKESANSLIEIAVKKFNSVQDVPFEQNPTWSIEDGKAINDIMWIIETYRKNAFNKTHIQIADSSENWLKSLEDRVQHPSTWKPSLAQLNALSIVSKGNAPDDTEAIVSLYNDLKKLK